MARALMIQGAGSDVGKSLIVAGLARAANRRGHRVLPFKPQNMSNNAAVTIDGGEIGRAQALQAQAAGVEPHTDMNPVLLKPETDIGAQVIVQGKRVATLRARRYAMLKPSLMPSVLESLAQLVGIKAVIDPDDAAMIEGFIINKFRGDPTLFDDGYAMIAERTSWCGFGVLPYFPRANELP